VTDARASVVLAESLVLPTPDGRVSVALAETLVLPVPDSRISTTLVEVAYRLTPATAATVTYWDGTRRRPARVRGWWDGSTLQTLKPVTEWVDGAGARHPLQG